ncbi:hypothetical protein OTU49_012393 [Cherax quadricarinatus]|uniref:Uncharacterized protein n=1 Tax=Cherax quadricarinatus TaxID=27406 RepID=A0AAW0VZL1_CHEQU
MRTREWESMRYHHFTLERFLTYFKGDDSRLRQMISVLCRLVKQIYMRGWLLKDGWTNHIYIDVTYNDTYVSIVDLVEPWLNFPKNSAFYNTKTRSVETCYVLGVKINEESANIAVKQVQNIVQYCIAFMNAPPEKLVRLSGSNFDASDKKNNTSVTSSPSDLISTSINKPNEPDGLVIQRRVHYPGDLINEYNQPDPVGQVEKKKKKRWKKIWHRLKKVFTFSSRKETGSTQGVARILEALRAGNHSTNLLQ